MRGLKTAKANSEMESRSRAEPSERSGHVAAGVEGKVYVWGGRRGYGRVSHDGPNKTEIIFSVDILDVKVRRYDQRRTWYVVVVHALHCIMNNLWLVILRTDL